VVVEKSYEIKLGGAPLTGEAENDIPVRYEMSVGFGGSGIWMFSSYPANLWMSIYEKAGKKKVGWGKGSLTVKLAPGDYYFRCRHAGSAEGMYTVSTTKVNEVPRTAKG
jgi:hypothetical protein